MDYVPSGSGRLKPAFPGIPSPSNNLQKLRAVLPAPDNGDVPGIGVNAVFHEFNHGFEGIVLRQRNNADDIPFIANPQPTAALILCFAAWSFGHVHTLT